MLLKVVILIVLIVFIGDSHIGSRFGSILPSLFPDPGPLCEASQILWKAGNEMYSKQIKIMQDTLTYYNKTEFDYCILGGDIIDNNQHVGAEIENLPVCLMGPRAIVNLAVEWFITLPGITKNTIIRGVYGTGSHTCDKAGNNLEEIFAEYLRGRGYNIELNRELDIEVAGLVIWGKHKEPSSNLKNPDDFLAIMNSKRNDEGKKPIDHAVFWHCHTSDVRYNYATQRGLTVFPANKFGGKIGEKYADGGNSKFRLDLGMGFMSIPKASPKQYKMWLSLIKLEHNKQQTEVFGV